MIDGDGAAVRARDLLDDGETESRAAYAIRSAAAIERLEEMAHVARGDAAAAVFDDDRDLVIVVLRALAHPSALAAVADRVGDQVLDRARERRRVGFDRRQLAGQVSLDVDVMLLRDPARLGDGLVDQ